MKLLSKIKQFGNDIFRCTEKNNNTNYIDISKPFTVSITGQDSVKTVSEYEHPCEKPVIIEFIQDKKKYEIQILPNELFKKIAIV